jgi:hypothetical protein
LQTPVVHAAFWVHAPPGLVCGTHDADPLQKLPPVHVSGSCAFCTGLHEPDPAKHDWQTPVQIELAQQKPSLQTPVVH